MNKRGLYSGVAWHLILFSLIVCVVLLLSVVGVGVAGKASADGMGDCDCLEYPAMHPDEAKLREWIDAYNNAPLAYIDNTKLGDSGAKHGSQDLLGHLQYVPAERDQGSCGNCWAWAGTGCLAVTLDVQEAIKERLSMQYLNSCKDGGYACCGGWLYELADFYDPLTGYKPSTNGTGKCIPWMNDNAGWQDGTSRCVDGSSEVLCSDVSTVPYYPITSIHEVTVSTQDVTQSVAIANIKYMLDQEKKAVWFGFYVPTSSWWSHFCVFWRDEAEEVVYDIDAWCGIPSCYCGHAVLCVGYDDSDPDNSYWVMLNSWGTTGDRPNGLLRVNMDMQYDGQTTAYCFYWQTLDVSFGDMPDIEVFPVSFEKTLLQYSSDMDTLNIGNASEDDLSYSISTYETGETGYAKVVLSCPWLEIDPDSGIVSGGAPANSVSLVFNTTGLAAGDHTADIVVSSNDPVEPEVVVPVTLHVEVVTKPVVTSNAATDVEEETALLNGQLDDCGGMQCDYRGFVWDDESYGDPGDIAPGNAAYESSWAEMGSFDTGIFNRGLSSLSKGNRYYFRACAHNAAGWSYGDELIFLTKSLAPAEFNAQAVSTSCINLSWVKGEGAQQTKIQRKQGEYPADRDDGTQVYFGAGNGTSDTGLMPGTNYCYRAWSWIEGSDQWSDEFAQASTTTASMSFNITLTQGWNLVSLPLIPVNTDIPGILAANNLASKNSSNAGLVYWYDTESEEWLYWISGVGTLSSMEEGPGYWVYVYDNDIVTIYGTEAGHPGPAYAVLNGWNMIGFTSLVEMAPESYLVSVAGDYNLLCCWNGGEWLWWMAGNPASTTISMKPGEGYWLYMETAGIINPP